MFKLMSIPMDGDIIPAIQEIQRWFLPTHAHLQLLLILPLLPLPRHKLILLGEIIQQMKVVFLFILMHLEILRQRMQIRLVIKSEFLVIVVRGLLGFRPMLVVIAGAIILVGPITQARLLIHAQVLPLLPPPLQSPALLKLLPQVEVI
ncbi:TPA: hypothetical protein DHT69_01785 [Candidatus Collierbacteria bacterium]|nr:hypothetical protein [Candidatus Collierbacteria bacterium]